MSVENGEMHIDDFKLYVQGLCPLSIYMHLFLLFEFGQVMTWNIATP